MFLKNYTARLSATRNSYGLYGILFVSTFVILKVRQPSMLYEAISLCLSKSTFPALSGTILSESNLCTVHSSGDLSSKQNEIE